jgi:hypothetical protein
MNQDEFRCILNKNDLDFILANSQFVNEFAFVKDTYTGKKRIRQKNNDISEKEYKTSIKGTTYRFGAEIEMKNLKGPTFLEHKMTDSEFSRWEIEFEGKIHERFKDRANIHGWQILVDQKK